MVKADVLRWLDEEEEKLKLIAMAGRDTGAQLTDEQILESEDLVTYERYFSQVQNTNAQIEQPDKRAMSVNQVYSADGRYGSKAGKISYDNFIKHHASENIFDNELLDQQYKFWESDEDREYRLRRLWIDLKRKNALGGVDATTADEHTDINKNAVELLRKIRWKVDQELTRRNIEPLFKNNYAGKYDKEEFLLDCDMEFFKVKKLLDKHPSVLKEDPLIGIDYMKIINLIKQKKLLEHSGDHFDSSNANKVHWHDMNVLERERLMKKKEEFDKYNRDKIMEMT